MPKVAPIEIKEEPAVAQAKEDAAKAIAEKPWVCVGCKAEADIPVTDSDPTGRFKCGACGKSHFAKTGF